MSHVLLIGCDPADAVILESSLRRARHQTLVYDLGEAGMDEILARPWDAVVTPSRGPFGSFIEHLAPRLQNQDWRPLSSVLVYESPAQEEEAGWEAVTSGADVFVDRQHIEALVPALESGLRRARRVAEQVQRLRETALKVQGLRAENETNQTPVDSANVAYGCLLVDEAGDVVGSDHRACQLLGREPRGQHLADLAPGGALLVPFRAAQHMPVVGNAFDLPNRRLENSSSVRSVCIPVGQDGAGLSVVLVYPEGAADKRIEDGAGGIPAIWAQSVTRVRRSLGASRIHAASRAGAQLRGRVREFAERRTPFAIVGERGVGRSSIARCVHYENPMAGSFYEVRSLAFSDRGLCKELFGPDGAIASLATADTLLISHLESVSSEIQERLVKHLRRSSKEPLRARLAVTVEGELSKLVPSIVALLGREVLQVPSVYQRPEDIPALAADALGAVTSIRPVPRIDEHTVRVLQAARLPGNIEELEDAMSRALQNSPDGLIHAHCLPDSLISTDDGEDGEWSQAPWSITESDPVSFETYERKAIQRALASCRGDKVAAAQLLEVGRSTLYRKLRSLGLE